MSAKNSKSLICLLSDHHDGAELDALRTCVVRKDKNFESNINHIHHSHYVLVGFDKTQE
jgi:hypothetical protein